MAAELNSDSSSSSSDESCGDNIQHLKQKKKLRFRLASVFGLVTLVLVLTAIIDYNYFHHERTCEIPMGGRVKRWQTLQTNLKHELFGQHIAVDGTLQALYAHITDPNPTKALVLSFHGWLGSGKTFLSRKIAEHLFDKGLESPFVKSFIGPRHFLLNPNKVKINQENLANTIESTIKKCEQSLFIFDEVDKMPSEIFDVLVPFLDHHGTIDGVNYRKSIFIFLSNSGGKQINDITANQLRIGGKREDLTIYDFHEAGVNGAFTTFGGLFKAQMITQRLVNHFIPFLPLERIHVLLCAKREMKRRNVLFVDPAQIADRVKFIEYSGGAKFAEDGCKNIATHVGYCLHSSDSMFNDEL